jgi:hypothetical protein
MLSARCDSSEEKTYQNTKLTIRQSLLKQLESLGLSFMSPFPPHCMVFKVKSLLSQSTTSQRFTRDMQVQILAQRLAIVTEFFVVFLSPSRKMLG